MQALRREIKKLGAILLTFSISILLGQFSPVRAQNASEDFFDQGEQEFDQEAETLEQPQNPNSKPMLTTEEEPSPIENTNEEETESGKPEVEDIPAPDILSPVSVEKSVPLQGSEQQPTLTLLTWATQAKPTPLPRAGWEVSQTTIIPTTTSETFAYSFNANEAQKTASQPNRWHFLFQPSIYIPVTIYGDATFGNSELTFTRDIAISGDQIRTAIKDDLNFAFFGDLQAWTPNYRVGLLANVNYLSASSQDTFTRSVRFPGLADFVPSELEAEVDTKVWYVNLAAAYRFYDRSKVNSEGVSTEFDLGTFVFDIVGGLNIASVNADLELSTNLDGQAEFDGGTTVVSPVLGGRLRVNTSPKLAWVTAGSVSGFGIGGLTQWSVRSGLDWMFSGNTSLGLGYRFGYVSYNKDLDRDRDFGVSLNQNGPYLSFAFRF